ncbi:unnamed protein product [Urochloa humidicola]
MASFVRMTGPLSPAGGNTDAPRRTPLIFLEKYARTGTGDAMNDDTTATAMWSNGRVLEISLWFHQPPALSYFCARRADAVANNHFNERPHVVGAEGRLALLRLERGQRGGSYRNEYEYFMYKAGFDEPGQPAASLDPIPLDHHIPSCITELAVVPRGHEYLIAALAVGMDRLYYELHIYSSEDKTWELILLQNPTPQLCKVITSKVVNLGEGLVAWVDYLHGMLVCDLHETKTNPTARYIPLPDPLPGNRDEVQRQLKELPGPCTGRYRDLACINGVLRFIEIEQHVKTQEPSFPPEKGTIVLDSDLIMSRQRKEPEPVVESWNGWTAVTWSRTISSAGWEMGIVVD